MKAKQNFPTIIESVIFLSMLLMIQFLIGSIIGLLQEIIGISIFSDKNLFADVFTLLTLGFGIDWARRQMKTDWSALLGLKTCNIGQYLILIVLSVGILLIKIEIGIYMQLLLPMPNYWKDMFTGMFSQNFTYNLLMVGLLFPLFEEILFKGVILKGFLLNYGKWTAIGLSAILFSCLHLNPWQGVPILFADLIMSWIFVQTDSLSFVIFQHSLNNILLLIFFDTFPQNSLLLGSLEMIILGSILILFSLAALKRTVNNIHTEIGKT